MFGKLGEFAIKHSKVIVATALLFFIGSAIYGLPVSLMLPAGGYDVADSESAKAREVLGDKFSADGLPIIFEISGTAGVNAPQVRAKADEVVAALKESPYAQQITSYWTAPAGVAASLVSDDQRTGLIVAQIAGSDSDAPPRAHNIAAPLIGSRDGVEVKAGGQAVAYYDFNLQSRIDLVTVEAIAVPFTFIVLVWIFGSAIAAMVPVLVAFVAITGTAAALRAIFAFTDVSVFAINLATALCLALAIDYTLFILQRYREELSSGATRENALRITMNTAGRTVLYSAITVGLSLASMIVFPMYFLRSLAYAGLIGVALCLVGALVIAPALLLVLGDKIEKWDLRGPIYRALGKEMVKQKVPEQTFFYRSSLFAIRNALVVIAVVVAIFITLGAPFLGIKVAYPDDRVLPTSAPARQAGDQLREQFSHFGFNAIKVVAPSGVASGAQLEDYAARLSSVEGVVSVSAPDGSYVGGHRVNVNSYGAAINSGAAYLTVSSSEDPYSPEGKTQLDSLKRISSPVQTVFGGVAQQNIDNVNGIIGKIPLALLLIAITTFILIFLLTGSVVLPIKAILMNVLSLSAAFGAMVWIFQEGHLWAFGTTATGNINAAFPPLIFCVAFGLSMDYEVFVLSRIREEWLQTPQQTAKDNERAIALGLARTGRIVTAAATVMAIVFLAIIASKMANMRMLGTGLAITVIADAFLIRTLLVPAFMGVMGKANWWAPMFLKRWHDRWGLREEQIPIHDDGANTHTRLAEHTSDSHQSQLSSSK